MGDQREKEVISDYWDAISGEKQTGEGSSYPVESAERAETAPHKSKAQKSTSKDKQDLETNTCQEITLDGDSKIKQRRRSERIKNKMSKIFSAVYHTHYFFI